MLIQYKMKSTVTNTLRRVFLGVTREARSLSGWQPKQEDKTLGGYMSQRQSIKTFHYRQSYPPLPSLNRGTR